MAEITEAAAQEFVRNEVKEYAQKAIELYYLGKELSQQWFGRNVGSIVGVDWPCPIANQNLTGNDVLNVVNRVTEYVTDLEAGSNAKLNTLIQMRG
jgi:hypothetical protein